jgi:hypothetical protein
MTDDSKNHSYWFEPMDAGGGKVNAEGRGQRTEKAIGIGYSKRMSAHQTPNAKHFRNKFAFPIFAKPSTINYQL